MGEGGGVACKLHVQNKKCNYIAVLLHAPMKILAIDTVNLFKKM